MVPHVLRFQAVVVTITPIRCHRDADAQSQGHLAKRPAKETTALRTLRWARTRPCRRSTGQTFSGWKTDKHDWAEVLGCKLSACYSRSQEHCHPDCPCLLQTQGDLFQDLEEAVTVVTTTAQIVVHHAGLTRKLALELWIPQDWQHAGSKSGAHMLLKRRQQGR